MRTVQAVTVYKDRRIEAHKDDTFVYEQGY